VSDQSLNGTSAHLDYSPCP